MAPVLALETTLLVHGVPRDRAPALARELERAVRSHGAEPAFVGVIAGRPIVGLSPADLQRLLDAPEVPKANTSNLGAFIHRRADAATTVSATMELAAREGVAVFATGGLGGVHPDYGRRLDISADLAALARFPVAVVCSGVKSILDVASTREALETLGVPVVGFRTDRFPEFYLRGRSVGLDARFDEEGDLAAFLRDELRRSGRGIVVANPIPDADALTPGDLDRWMTEAAALAGPLARGRETTPALLARLHEVSGGATLRANVALALSNAALGARLAALVAP